MRLIYSYLLTVIIWSFVALVVLATRPILPVDETRYLTVAWEMWRDGNWIVPQLNGEPYHHKPPLLFWLINGMWWITGPSETVARIIPIFISFLSCLLFSTVVKQLWPRDRLSQTMAPLILSGFAVFLLFGSLVMFDGLLTLLTLGAVWSVLHVWRGSRTGDKLLGWLLFALAGGLGILAKGPVALLHISFVPLLAPLWMGRENRPEGSGLSGWSGWYLGWLVGFIGACCLGLSWALPAAEAGGEAYGNMLLWGQTAGRITNAFDHARPWYFYLLILPLLALPWGFWPELIKGGRRGWHKDRSAGALPLVWSCAGLLIFSLVSAKQVHYLLPLLPAFALLVLWALRSCQAVHKEDLDICLEERKLSISWGYMLPFVLLLIPLGFFALSSEIRHELISTLPRLGDGKSIPSWLWESSELPAYLGLIALVILAVSGSISGRKTLSSAVRRPVLLALVCPVFFTTIHYVGTTGPFMPYDWTRLKDCFRQADGRGISYSQEYDGEFGFIARLEDKVVALDRKNFTTWLASHPEGFALYKYKQDAKLEGLPKPDGSMLYRGSRLALWVGKQGRNCLPPDIKGHF
ncbi:ArnT family glycosyltransferase [Kiloniella majae]|uniref:ArnT family glycosyltransferase n=1 Tax=Kiloniella majae TaxID=1938558 RepID=UPI000A279873|nr:glycosyltransferase family 39 protein [Kiloniella majae]